MWCSIRDGVTGPGNVDCKPSMMLKMWLKHTGYVKCKSFLFSFWNSQSRLNLYTTQFFQNVHKDILCSCHHMWNCNLWSQYSSKCILLFFTENQLKPDNWQIHIHVHIISYWFNFDFKHVKCSCETNCPKLCLQSRITFDARWGKKKGLFTSFQGALKSVKMPQIPMS